jgi:hypothetical protein
MPPVLESYDAIEQGRTFSLVIAQDERGVWHPARSLGMPHHHASSIEWRESALLDAHRGARVVVAATGLGRTSLEHDPGRHVWFATYAARIDRVCPEQAIPSRDGAP